MNNYESSTQYIRMLEIILDNIFGYVCVEDAKGKILYVNKGCADLHNMKKNDFLNMTIYDMVKKGLVSDAAGIHVIERKEPMRTRITTSQGHVVLVTGQPIFDDNGELSLVVTNSNDENLYHDFLNSLQIKNDSLQRAFDAVTFQHLGNEAVIAKSPITRQLFETAAIAAKSDSTILLNGESGTGKEVFAHFIHQNSNRHDKVFIPINCAAMPPELLESELFGYEKNSFTGASNQGKIGLFEAADKGTLFLDEIGEIPITLQSKLLRVLESGEIKRVGGNTIRKVNVRIIAATNRNLKNMVCNGEFREDLYYRLNVIPIRVPPLRERQEDIIAFAEFFVNILNKKYNKNIKFSTYAIKEFLSYDWPGNIREMRNIIERIFVVSQNDVIEVSSVRMALGDISFSKSKNNVSTPYEIENYNDNLKEATDAFQRQFIINILTSCDGNVELAAEKICMHKSGLYKKINTLNIELKEITSKK